jgi:hypothetical protein
MSCSRRSSEQARGVLEDDFAQEIVRTRQNAKLMAFLDERARQSQTIPLDEVKRQLGLSE